VERGLAIVVIRRGRRGGARFTLARLGRRDRLGAGVRARRWQRSPLEDLRRRIGVLVDQRRQLGLGVLGEKLL
jgi:hypothetical protein